MRRLRTVLLVLAGAFTLTVSASAIVGIPEIDKANADIRLSAKPAFTVTRCAGEDGISYLTYLGGWSGTEADVTPGSTDYTLSGAITVRNVVWTINTQTQRGVLTGSAVLLPPPGAGTAKTYAGTLTLITAAHPQCRRLGLGPRVANSEDLYQWHGRRRQPAREHRTHDLQHLHRRRRIRRLGVDVQHPELRRHHREPDLLTDAVCGKPIGEPHCRLRCGNGAMSGLDDLSSHSVPRHSRLPIGAQNDPRRRRLPSSVSRPPGQSW